MLGAWKIPKNFRCIPTVGFESGVSFSYPCIHYAKQLFWHSWDVYKGIAQTGFLDGFSRFMTRPAGLLRTLEIIAVRVGEGLEGF